MVDGASAVPIDGALDPSDASIDADAALSDAERELGMVLLTLAHARHEGRTGLSLARLSKRCSLPMSTLLRYLNVLVEAQWVVVHDAERGLRVASLTDIGVQQCATMGN